MRDLITGLAILLLVALTAALVGPHVLDWEGRRTEIARQLSAALGQEVVIDGPVSLALIPTPAVKLGHVRLAEGGLLSGSVGRVKATAAIPPLLRGQIRLTDMRLQGGRLVLSPGGNNPLAGAASAPFGIAIERLEISDTDLTIRAEGGTDLITLADISGTLDAGAITGPFRGTLGFTARGARRSLRFSTGSIANAAIRLRALSENEEAAARMEYDGVVSWAGERLAIDGRVSASGNVEAAMPEGRRNMLWRIEAQLKGTAAGVAADQVEVALGPSDRQMLLAGAADIDLAGPPRVTATLAARQIDLDRLLATEDGRPPLPPEALVRQVTGGNGGPILVSPVALRADITVGSMLVGGGVIAAPRAVLTADAAGLRLEEASGELPGGARLSLRMPEAGSGPVSADIRDLPAFLTWLQGTPVKQTPVRSLSVEGALRKVPSGFRIDEAAIRADEMRFSGSFGADVAGARPRIFADLRADQLDILKLPDLGDGAGQALHDLDLTLDARRVRYAGVGAGAIRASLSRRGDVVTLGELTVRDLDGAAMRASGSLGGVQSKLDAEVDATRLEALLELLERLLPHPVLPQLKARARALAPARLAMTAQPAPGDGWALSLKGAVGGTEVSGVLKLDRDGGIAPGDGISLDLAAPSLGPLLRKFGVPAIDAPGAGPLKLALRGGGLGAAPRAAWSLRGSVGRTTLDVSGDLKADPAEKFAGRINLETADISPITQTLLVAVPRVPPGQPLRLAGGIDLRGYRITLREMDARFGAVPVTGEITFDLAQFGRVTGQLQTPHFDAGVVAPLIFGEPGDRQDGWSAATFTRAAGATLPGDLWIEAGEARLAGGLTVERPGFVLRFDDGLLFLEHARGKLGDIQVKASGTLRRTGRSVSLAGRVGFAGGVGPARMGEGEIDFTGLGDSPAQLVAALSGGGNLRFRDARLPALVRGSFAELAQPRERIDNLSRSAVADRLRGNVRDSIMLPAGEAKLTLAGGVISAGPLAVSDGESAITAGLSYDLRSFAMGGRMAYVARTPPKGWTGPAPQAVLTWRGPIGAPRLEVEADEFANGLTALAIQRETERIEALEQDQRERAFFNRRLRASEAERRAAEEEARRLAEEKLRAEDERKRAELAARQRVERERGDRLREEEALRALTTPPPPPISILPPAAR